MKRYVIRFGSFPWYFNGYETGKLSFAHFPDSAISWGSKESAELMRDMLNGQFYTREFGVFEIS